MHITVHVPDWTLTALVSITMEGITTEVDMSVGVVVMAVVGVAERIPIP